MSKAGTPSISVLVPTWNWSSALALALASIQAQTFKDFEVLVVGDACTDDSAEVVASLKDERFSWHNLDNNCGSQWGPNNRGLELARGHCIAYLGHDDLWWPTHLAVAHRLLEQGTSDIVAAAAILYGPAESGVRALSGFFPHGEYSPRIFFPPTSMVHRKALAARVGGWRSPELCHVATDFDFLIRCHAAGARFAATGEVTAFKFTAAWRRDAYRSRDTSRQRDYLRRMLKDGERFRLEELSATLHAAAEGRLMSAALPANVPAGTFGAAIQQFKGSRSRSARPPGTWVEGRLRFAPQDEYQGLEWHALEEHPAVGRYRWSGPSTRSTIVLPVSIDRPIDVTLLLVGWITDAALHSAKLFINDAAVTTTLEATGESRYLWRARIEPNRLAATDREEARLTLVLDRTHRALDLGIGTDPRWLGLAVAWVEVDGLEPS